MTGPEPVWLLRAVVEAIHDEQLAEHGGAEGLRDAGLLESALARPRNLAAYGTAPSMAALAAAYGYGIARNHPFIDGNKRTAFVAVESFLVLNGHALTAGDAESITVMERLADGRMSEQEFAAWIRARI